MCGPEGMMKNVDNLLAEHQIPKDKIFKESFVAGVLDKPKKEEEKGTEKKTRDVTIRYDGNEHIISVPHNKTILETALNKGNRFALLLPKWFVYRLPRQGLIRSG